MIPYDQDRIDSTHPRVGSRAKALGASKSVCINIRHLLPSYLHTNIFPCLSSMKYQFSETQSKATCVTAEGNTKTELKCRTKTESCSENRKENKSTSCYIKICKKADSHDNEAVISMSHLAFELNPTHLKEAREGLDACKNTLTISQRKFGSFNNDTQHMFNSEC